MVDAANFAQLLQRAGDARREDARRIRRTVRAAANPTLVLSTVQPTLTWSTQASATPLTGGTVRTLASTTGQHRFIGVPVKNQTYGYVANNVNNGDTTNEIVEFDFISSLSAPNMALLWRASGSGSAWMIYVNGLPLTATQIAPTGITQSGGTLYRLALTFSTPGAYRVRIEMDYPQIYGYEYISGDAITPTPSLNPLCVLIGDSFVQGANGVSTFGSWAYQLGSLLGMEVINCGQGGTGYTQDSGIGSRTRYDNSARMAAAAVMKPEYAIIFGSVNDLAQATTDPTVIGPAAARVYAYWQANSPTTKLIVIGIQRALPAQLTAATAGQAQIKAAALAAGNVLGFIDPLTGYWYTKSRQGGTGTPWFSGTGYSTSPQANDDGTMLISSDNVHPSSAGHAHLARRAFSQITDVLAAA